MTKIWINESWHVHVDDLGFVTRSDEGTLGCILQLRNEHDRNARLAMKIPRLLADTIKENAYICEITQDEMDNVGKAQQGGNQGLLNAETLQANILAKRRSTSQAEAESARKQDRHVILLQFDKRYKPRLCCVNFDNDKQPSVYPSSMTDEIRSFIPDQATWQSLAKESLDEHGEVEFAKPAYLVKTSKAKLVGSLPAQMSLDRIEEAWYVGLPCITFDWSSGTLQKALGTGILKDWQLDDYFNLFSQIISGVKTLHQKGLLHGDLRPANIMAVGDLNLPESYKVGDYGSFSIDKARISSQSSGHTMTGPGVGKTRATPFYSEERRAGIEREAAESAVILRNANGPISAHYVIRLGWNDELFKTAGGAIDQDKTVTDALRTRILNEAPSESESSVSVSDERLGNGDRIRLRDYIFEIISVNDLGPSGMSLRCKSQFAHILHDRIAVYDHSVESPDGDIRSGIEDNTVISLPSYIEYRQWSTATDVYSIGALFLYCLYYNTQIENDESVEKVLGNHNINIESKFTEMLSILESKPYFQSFWEDLARFAKTVDLLRNEYQGQQIPAEVASEYPVPEASGTTLLRSAIEAVNNIVQSAPHVRSLLEPFSRKHPTKNGAKQFNVAGFLLLIHFSLGCIHRRSHLKQQTNTMIPFCRDRREMIEDDADEDQIAIACANKRLELVRSIVNEGWIFSFYVDEDKIATFSPRNEFNIRLERWEWIGKAEDALRGNKKYNSRLIFGKQANMFFELAEAICKAKQDERES